MKKHCVIIVCLLVLLAFLLCNLCNRNRKPIIETFNMDSTTEEEITDELAIALFIKDITEEIMNYYSEYNVIKLITNCLKWLDAFYEV